MLSPEMQKVFDAEYVMGEIKRLIRRADRTLSEMRRVAEEGNDGES